MVPPLPRRQPVAALCALVAAGMLQWSVAMAAPVLTSAQASVTYTSPTACAVEMTVSVAGAAEVEHRLELLEGASVTLDGTTGATASGAVREIGRTRSLVLVPATSGSAYSLQYHVEQTPSRPGRCPIWLPTAPASGRGRDVTVRVQVPDGTVPSGSMPTLTWQGTTGTAVVPHLPAFVIVPWAPAGAGRPWDISRVMDVVALTSIVVASALWLRRKQTVH